MTDAIAFHVVVAFLFGACAGFVLDRIMRFVIDRMERSRRAADAG